MTERLYLFRYRDLLTDDTLGQHRALIDEHGGCYWGWWQRPHEDPRMDIWTELERQTQAGPLDIALFNSDPTKSRGLIHRATLSRVLVPNDARGPAVPEADQYLVPRYYRSTPFSSAWLYLTHIEAHPQEPFFRAYSYARAPRLHAIDRQQSERFIDKLVIDAEELRAMDTTIWALRPATSGDRDERILTANLHLDAPISRRPIALSSNRMLHLSDLHFTTPEFKRDEHRWALINEGGSTLHDQIKRALGETPNIGLVVVTGDLTYRASSDEFYEAFRFLHALMGWLKLGPDHLVVIPGNHDLMWTKQAGEAWDPNAPVSEAPDAAKHSYQTFYQRVFRHEAAPDLSVARRFVLPNGVCLELAGLNSSGLEQGREWLAGMGRLPDGAWDRVSRALGWNEEASQALRMLLVHHHVSATEDVLPHAEFSRGFGMAVDAKQTLRKAAHAGVQLILHGHRHQPHIGAEQVYAELERTTTSWALGRVGVVGGGSAGSTAVKNHNNFFNLFELNPNGVDLTIYHAHSPEGRREAFAKMQTWRAGLTTDERGQLVLGDWERPTP